MRINIKAKIIAVAAFFVFALNSCQDEKIIFEDYTNIQGSWDRDSSINFQLEIEDTSRLYTLNYIVRNNHSYKFCNIYLKYTLSSKDSALVSKFQEILFYNPKNGEPLGKTQLLSDIQEGYYPVAQVKFPVVGTYNLSISHQMRDNQTLEGLESLGVQVK